MEVKSLTFFHSIYVNFLTFVSRKSLTNNKNNSYQRIKVVDLQEEVQEFKPTQEKKSNFWDNVD